MRLGFITLIAVLLLGALPVEAAPTSAPQRPTTQLRSPGQFKLFLDTTVDGKPSRRPYYLSVPDSPRLRDPAARLPMVVFLHGICEGGEDHQALFIEAIPLYCRDRKEFQKGSPFMFLSPQAPAGRHWDSPDMPAFVAKTIAEVVSTYPVDAGRIYLTGLSSGGTGTWRIAMDYPKLFAAIAPISARALEPENIARKLPKMPVWLAVGGQDGDFVLAASRMAAAARAGGSEVNLKVVPNFGHVIWDQAFLDDELYRWLLRHSLAGAQPVDAGGWSSSADAARPLDAAVAQDALARAAKLKALGKIVEAYRTLRTTAMTGTSPKVTQAIAAIEADPKFAQQYKSAQDEDSAREMLNIGKQQLAQGQRDIARDTFQKVVDVWPVTQVAREARAELLRLPRKA